MSKNYVITIARGFGSGGKQTATQIGEKLGIPVYEKQILEMASAYSGLSEEMFIEVDEKLRGNYVTNALAKFTFPIPAGCNALEMYGKVINGKIIEDIVNIEFRR